MTLDPLPTLTAYVAPARRPVDLATDHAAYAAAYDRALRTAEATTSPVTARNQRIIAAALVAECIRLTGRRP